MTLPADRRLAGSGLGPHGARRLRLRATALAGLFIVVSGASPAQRVHFVAEGKDDILQRVNTVPASDEERAAQIKKWFSEAGCVDRFLREQPVEGSATPNVVCELPGRGDETVIVTSPYDLRTVDTWSGASLLPALYQCLRSKRRHHRFTFVAFADRGAASFAEQLSATELRHTSAVVHLGVLGLSPTKIWTSHSDKDLVHDLMVMAYALKLPASQVDLENGGSENSNFFAERQVPQITIHSLTRANLDNGATPFQAGSYYDTYRLLCGYLAYLDTILKPRLRTP
jgi:hypothetical protein